MSKQQTEPLLHNDTQTQPTKKRLFHNVGLVFAVTVWMGSLSLVASTMLLVIIRFAMFGISDPVALTVSAIWVLLSLIPLGTPVWAANFVKWAAAQAEEYFPVEVVLEDPDAWKMGGPYMVGFEPHSAMPVAMPPVFCPGSPMLPKQLQPCNTFASNVCFITPVVRHMYHWLGVRPISRQTISSHLDQGCSVVLIPGGVREILHMAHGKEVAFLKRRTGFIRLALQHGAPLVPAFGFGQTDAYYWCKPGPPWFPEFLMHAMSRSMGFVPLLFWGRWGTPVPVNTKMTVVLGRPVITPRVQDPSKEQVDEYLQRFIAEMQRLFDTHKAAAGYPDLTLEIL